MAASEHPKLAFPSSFMWGTATASFQIEGCTQLGGRGPSIWDRFCSEKGRVANGDNGDPACDHYRRWRSDIDLIAGLGLPYYRFSIAWPRIYPRGVKGGLNEEGVEFYRNLIQGLKKKGVEPVATLYHWDLPTAIEDETGGWAGEGGVVEEFEAYARTCFEQFGDVVKWWITINEPWCCALLGYEVGEHAPGKIDKPGVNLYRAGHNLLLAHARGAKVYHDEFQDKQQGKIGITLNADWAEGVEERGQDAAARDMAFCLGWFADPIYLGDYPAVMREACGERLPKFTKAEKAMLKGSSDFLGLNHYSTHMVTGLKNENEFKDQGPSYYKDQRVASCELPEWKHSDMGWPIVPWGFRKLLVYMQERYNPSGGIIITENGLASAEPDMKAVQNDKLRIQYITSYIQQVELAIAEGADVRGYFLWSLLDNFEWAYGYSKRFGIIHVNYKTQERVLKPVALVYSDIVKSNGLPQGISSKIVNPPENDVDELKRMTSMM